MKEIFAVLSGVFCVAGFTPYIFTTLKGKTKPSKASWIIWGGLDAIAMLGMWAENALNIQIIVSTTGACIVGLLSLWYGVPGWTKIDKFCLGGAFLGIGLWWIFSNPLLGILTSLTVIFIGSIPIFIQTWQKPKDENKTAWILFAISATFAVLAIPKWSPQDAAQPLTFLSIELIMVYLICICPATK